MAVFVNFIMDTLDSPLNQELGFFPDQIIQEFDGPNRIFTGGGDRHPLGCLDIGGIALEFFDDLVKHNREGDKDTLRVITEENLLGLLDLPVLVKSAEHPSGA